MRSDRQHRIEELFSLAQGLPADQRRDFLQARCNGDVELVTQVLALLRSHDRIPDAFILGDLSEAETEAAAPDRVPGGAEARAAAMEGGEGALATGSHVGAYRIVREIGRGGMSTVYLAERDDGAFQRQVALKVIRGTEAHNEVYHHRFEKERQVLAGLTHPNIARLYDGGMTASGVPYLVMELIAGEPIDRYCDHRRLTIRQRLELMGAVCAAVQAAHRSLVVHRDIKPSNILVASDGEPKLLDFGIAKLLDPQLHSVHSQPTSAYLRLMTPNYASPEQIRGGTITTASDVYALGVLLYELLTGHLPRRLTGCSLGEMEQRITRGEPPKPSAAIVRTSAPAGSSAESSLPTAEQISAARSTHPQQLRRALTGDLDNIVLKAMHSDPARRYSSAESLAEDIHRYLSGFPVRARADTFAYRAGKLLRRRWPALFAAATFILLLAGSALGFALQAAHIERQARRIAEERDTAQEAIRFMKDVFQVATEGEALTVRQAVDRSAASLRYQLRDEPEVRGTLLDALGTIYLNLEVMDRAAPTLEEAVAMRRELFGAQSTAYAQSLSSLGLARALAGPFAEGAPHLYQAIEILESQRPEQPAELVRALNNLVRAICFRETDLDEAEVPSIRALSLARAHLPASNPELGQALIDRAYLLDAAGHYPQAVDLYQEARQQIREHRGAEHPSIGPVLNNLAMTLLREGRLAEAGAMLDETLQRNRELFGEDDPRYAIVLNNRAAVLRGQRRFVEAAAMTGQALEILRSADAADIYFPVLTADLAAALDGQGESREAAALLAQPLARWRQELGDDWIVAHMESVRTAALASTLPKEEVSALLHGAYATLEAQHGAHAYRTRDAHCRYCCFTGATNERMVAGCEDLAMAETCSHIPLCR